jgi:hypothetical protein
MSVGFDLELNGCKGHISYEETMFRVTFTSKDGDCDPRFVPEFEGMTKADATNLLESFRSKPNKKLILDTEHVKFSILVDEIGVAVIFAEAKMGTGFNGVTLRFDYRERRFNENEVAEGLKGVIRQGRTGTSNEAGSRRLDQIMREDDDAGGGKDHAPSSSAGGRDRSDSGGDTPSRREPGPAPGVDHN